MQKVRPVILISVILFSVAVTARAEYSNWSFGGGLDLVYNADSTVKRTTDGSPQGLQSGPSPIAGYLIGEYRLPLGARVNFAPSASIMFLQYLWAYERALPAEMENRTAFVPTMFLELPFVYQIETGRIRFSFGLGPGFLIRYGFLESGVSPDEKSYASDMPAGEQVAAINAYLWDQGRWFCPSAQIGLRYRLETGWGANFTIKAGVPVSNLWTTPTVPFIDSFMFMAAILITPPAPQPANLKNSAPADAQETSGDPETSALPETPGSSGAAK
jgi:hypothetical protein